MGDRPVAVVETAGAALSVGGRRGLRGDGQTEAPGHEKQRAAERDEQQKGGTERQHRSGYGLRLVRSRRKCLGGRTVGPRRGDDVGVGQTKPAGWIYGRGAGRRMTISHARPPGFIHVRLDAQPGSGAALPSPVSGGAIQNYYRRQRAWVGTCGFPAGRVQCPAEVGQRPGRVEPPGLPSSEKALDLPFFGRRSATARQLLTRRSPRLGRGLQASRQERRAEPCHRGGWHTHRAALRGGKRSCLHALWSRAPDSSSLCPAC